LAPVLRAIFVLVRGSFLEDCIKVKLSAENSVEHAGRRETAQSA